MGLADVDCLRINYDVQSEGELVVIGVIVASRHDYYSCLAIVSRVVSAVVATALCR